MRAKKAYWIGRTHSPPCSGFGLVDCWLPRWQDLAGSLAIVTGYLLVIVGITIVARATRRKDSEALPHDRKEPGLSPVETAIRR